MWKTEGHLSSYVMVGVVFQILVGRLMAWRSEQIVQTGTN